MKAYIDIPLLASIVTVCCAKVATAVRQQQGSPFQGRVTSQRTPQAGPVPLLPIIQNMSMSDHPTIIPSFDKLSNARLLVDVVCFSSLTYTAIPILPVDAPEIASEAEWHAARFALPTTALDMVSPRDSILETAANLVLVAQDTGMPPAYQRLPAIC